MGVTAVHERILSRHDCAQRTLRWLRWLKRVFDIDLEHCPHYGGTLKIIAAIVHPPIIPKILPQPRLVRPGPEPIPGAAAIPSSGRQQGQSLALAFELFQMA